MILNPPEQAAEKWGFLQKSAFSCRKNTLSCRNMPFPADKCAFRGAHGTKPHEISGGLRAQESRALGNFHKNKALSACLKRLQRLSVEYSPIWAFQHLMSVVLKLLKFKLFSPVVTHTINVQSTSPRGWFQLQRAWIQHLLF